MAVSKNQHKNGRNKFKWQNKQLQSTQKRQLTKTENPKQNRQESPEQWPPVTFC
jgi:hypothetical protein